MYILLTPIDALGLDTSHATDNDTMCLAGCSFLSSLDGDGHGISFATSVDLRTLQHIRKAFGLPGVIVSFDRLPKVASLFQQPKE